MDKKKIIEQFNKNSIIKFPPVIVDITKLVYTHYNPPPETSLNSISYPLGSLMYIDCDLSN